MEKETQDYLDGFFLARRLAWESKIKQLSQPSFKEYAQHRTGDTKNINQEFRTLHLDFGRQTGNSYWMASKCCDLSVGENTPEKRVIKTEHCFCFFYSYNMEKCFWDKIGLINKKKIYKEDTNIHTYTFSKMRGFQHFPNSYAFVDVSCMLGEKNLDQIMESDQWEIICLL